MNYTHEIQAMQHRLIALREEVSAACEEFTAENYDVMVDALRYLDNATSDCLVALERVYDQLEEVNENGAGIRE